MQWQWSVALYKNRKYVQNKRRKNTQNNTKTIQKHRIHKIENKNATQENKHKKNVKNTNRVIIK
jgi:hypothetical protein